MPDASHNRARGASCPACRSRRRSRPDTLTTSRKRLALLKKFGISFVKPSSRTASISTTLARRALSPGGQLAGNVAGLTLIALGAATIVIALVRFRKTAREIDSPVPLPGAGERLDVALAALLVILGTALFVYLSYTVISQL